MSKARDQFFIIEKDIPTGREYIGQTVFPTKEKAVKAAEKLLSEMREYARARTDLLVYGWLGINGAYNPNTADEWIDPDVAVLIGW